MVKLVVAAVVVVVVDAEVNKMENIPCPLCHEEIYSEIGKACKMCSMTLEDESKDFCSKNCRINYTKTREGFLWVKNH
jgi:hypothetical protein